MPTKPVNGMAFNPVIRNVRIEMFTEFITSVVEPNHSRSVSRAVRTLMFQAILEQNARDRRLELVLHQQEAQAFAGRCFVLEDKVEDNQASGEVWLAARFKNS